MTANPLKGHFEQTDRIIPPSDPQQRVTFWLEHGNQRLREIGKHHLCWVWRNGSYSIEERD